MITGIVSRDEAVFPLNVHGRQGKSQEIMTVIDTGFTAWLTLPSDVVAALSLRWHGLGRGTLADGSEI